eukprot:TRINITY_DN19791_c0_g1_i1.p1 TRINITY_DN19791_c0_g1~~TRINITY_DN19791_c0_g1_i1.p1  ORF type:complete len:485 (+),score=90.60 TRINITY_DN19791_c0_g1_i1:91-1545(+)
MGNCNPRGADEQPSVGPRIEVSPCWRRSPPNQRSRSPSTTSRNSRRTSHSSAPLSGSFQSDGMPRHLMANERSRQCCGCSKAFGITRRAYRCRGCGRCFCALCTPYRELFVWTGSVPQRCCSSCRAARGGTSPGGAAGRAAQSPGELQRTGSVTASIVHAGWGIGRAWDSLSGAGFCKGETGDAWVLGEQFLNPVGDGRSVLEMRLDSFAWFSYRRGFRLCGDPESYDTGWGCVHRSAQMLLACAVRRAMLPQSAQYSGQESAELFGLWRSDLLPLFRDVPEAPFSIQRMVEEAERLGTPPREWLGPAAAAGCLAAVVHGAAAAAPSTWALGVVLAENGAVSRQELAAAAAGGCALLLVPTRLGTTEVNSEYLDQLSACLKVRSCCGIIAGRRRQGFYAVGVCGDHFIFLDPHSVQSAYTDPRVPGCTTDPKLHSMPRGSVEPSLLLSFICSREAAGVEANVDELMDDLRLVNAAGRHPLFSLH